MAEIEASTEVIGTRGTTAKVVKVRTYAVKYGTGVSLGEAQNLSYIAGKCSALLVPKVYGTLSEKRTLRNFIIMEYIDGQSLDKVLPSLSAAEKSEICHQLHEAVTQMRDIPAPDYIGSINHGDCPDGLLCTPPPIDPLTSGPFSDENAMNEGMLRRLAETESEAYINFLRSLIDQTLKGHRICFAHEDLQAKNIVVRRKSKQQSEELRADMRTGKDVNSSGENLEEVMRFESPAYTSLVQNGTDEEIGSKMEWEVIFLDWENSGWYPEYWDFCIAAYTARFLPEYLEVVTQALDVYPQEYLMMKMLRDMIFA